MTNELKTLVIYFRGVMDAVDASDGDLNRLSLRIDASLYPAIARCLEVTHADVLAAGLELADDGQHGPFSHYGEWHSACSRLQWLMKQADTENNSWIQGDWAFYALMRVAADRFGAWQYYDSVERRWWEV